MKGFFVFINIHMSQNLNYVSSTTPRPITNTRLDNIGATVIPNPTLETFNINNLLLDKLANSKNPLHFLTGDGTYLTSLSGNISDKFFSAYVLNKYSFGNLWYLSYNMNENLVFNYFDGKYDFARFSINYLDGTMSSIKSDLRNGNKAYCNTEHQLGFGYSSDKNISHNSLFRHNFRTTHAGTSDKNGYNAIELYTWDAINDLPEELGSKRVMRWNALGNEELISGFRIDGGVTLPVSTLPELNIEKNKYSVSGKGVIYFNKSENKYRYSENGGYFKNLGSGSSDNNCLIQGCTSSLTESDFKAESLTYCSSGSNIFNYFFTDSTITSNIDIGFANYQAVPYNVVLPDPSEKMLGVNLYIYYRTVSNNLAKVDFLHDGFSDVFSNGDTPTNITIASIGSTSRYVEIGGTMFVNRNNSPATTGIYNVVDFTGVEQLLTTGWTLNSGWTGDFTTGFIHSSGTDTLVNSETIGTDTRYKLIVTITGRTLGSIVVSVGGVAYEYTANATTNIVSVGTSSLVVTPTTDFNGTVKISLLYITNVVLVYNEELTVSTLTSVNQLFISTNGSVGSPGTLTYNKITGINPVTATYNISTGSLLNTISFNTIRAFYLNSQSSYEADTMLIENNIPLTGLSIVGGVQLLDNSIVLVNRNSSLPLNGVYRAHSGAWTRDTNFEQNINFNRINEIKITHADSIYLNKWYSNVLVNNFNLGTTDIMFAESDGSHSLRSDFIFDNGTLFQDPGHTYQDTTLVYTGKSSVRVHLKCIKTISEKLEYVNSSFQIPALDKDKYAWLVFSEKTLV